MHSFAVLQYDPLYRLTGATGRECKDIPRPRPWTDDPRCGVNSPNHGTPNQDNAPNLTAVYHEDYAYDPVGNMTSMAHRTNGFAWTRHFGMGGLTPDQWRNEWPSHLGTDEWPNPPGNRLTHVGDEPRQPHRRMSTTPTATSSRRPPRATSSGTTATR